jgi:uncharacterized membrane protein HdeD (DUF308 family)
MDDTTRSSSGKLNLTDLQEFSRNWGWFLALGLILIALGVIALGRLLFVTMASVVFFGWLLVIAGAIEALQAFGQHRWGGFFLHLFGGILYVVVGLMFVANPAVSALSLTLIMALFFMVSGAFRIVVALSMRFPEWRWLLINGLVTLGLGLLIWKQWPVSGLWVIGLFIGFELIYTGVSWVFLSLAARRLASP